MSHASHVDGNGKLEISGTVAKVVQLLRGRESEHVRVSLKFDGPTETKEDEDTPSPVSPEKALLTAQEVAEVLGMTDRKRPADAVRYLHRTRQLPAVKVSGRLRWKREDVERFARELRN